MGRRFLEETGQAGGGSGSSGSGSSSRSGSSGSGDEPTKAELYERAKERDVEGRSTMSKDELKQALEGEG
jgi:hypothetical protein